MKDLLIAGTRFLTSDEVADSLLEYARLLSLYQRADTVRFPALVGGTVAQSAIVIGLNNPFAVVDATDVIPVRLAGVDEAVADLRRRSAHYRDASTDSAERPGD